MLDRRDALKSIIVGSVASIFSPNTLLASTAKKKEKLGIALVGLGYYSTDLLAPALQTTEKCYLAGIVTGTPEKAEKWKQKYNIPDKNIYNYQNFDSIANNPDIDIVYVVLPPSMHKEYTIRAAKAGKHVFCEKPLCSNDSEANRLSEIAKGRNVVLQVGHSERFHEAWEKLKANFQKLTPPFTVRINRVAPFKGRATDVDVVQDLAIHDLDLVLYLFMQKPLQVTATGYKIRTQNWDHANIHLKLEQNSEVHIVVGRNSVKEMRDLEVISSDGMITVDLFTNKIYHATNEKFEDGTFVKEEAYQKRDHLFLEHQHFYNSIQQSLSPVIGLKDGLNAVHLVDCALKSMSTGSPVQVKLG
jgi:predicted dehydrogenase